MSHPHRRRALFLALTVAASTASSARADFNYVRTNLVSDVAGMALTTDASLRNPWGIAASATSPFWLSNQAAGNSTLYNTLGAKQALAVTVANAATSGPTGPTGVVFNPSTDFKLANGNKANFLFANLDGSISGWNTGTVSEVKSSTAGAAYTGIALGAVAVGPAVGNFLYATDFANNRIDVLDANFAKTQLFAPFLDPNLPAGLRPYNIQNIGGELFVSYRGATGGAVNVFDTGGNLLRRIAVNGANGLLQSPWGLALAPANFGSLGGALLVGNQDTGTIQGYNPQTGAFVGTLLNWNGSQFSIPGLWGLRFGNGGNGGAADILYFAAGINNEVNGLFGSLSVPEPGSVVLTALGAGMLGLIARRRRSLKPTV